MGFTWKEIVPSDPYCLKMADRITPSELIYITQLYQPLIGPLSVSLYMTLCHEYSLELKETTMGNHRGLMSMMGTALDKIVTARENLEAVGLLKTMKVEETEGNIYYEYVLLSPMTPSQFFSDDMLSIILLNRVGKVKYRELRGKLLTPKEELPRNGTRMDLTKSFDQVFCTITPSELMVKPGSETDQFLQEIERQFPLVQSLHSSQEKEIVLKTVEPDFAFLEASLPKTGLKSRTLSTELKSVIKELAFLYGLDDLQLSYFLQDPFVSLEDHEIRPDKLWQLVKEWYHREHQGEPAIQRKPPSSRLKTEETPTNLTKEDAHKQAMATVSPVTLLEQYQQGSKVSPADLKIVEELAGSYSLPTGVINVLLEYVMLTNNKQLPRALIFKIASHWKRLKIGTVDEALEQAKQLYQENKQTTQKQPPNTRKEVTPRKGSSTKKDVLPQWVAQQKTSTSASIERELDEEQKRQAQELLRALGELDP